LLGSPGEPSFPHRGRRSAAARLAAISALFLDFDGTLVAIRPRGPEAVVVEPWVLPTLQALHDRLDGATGADQRPAAGAD
jgi:hypothetical protein